MSYEYDERGSQLNNGGKKDNDVFSWAVIAIAFTIWWPIGLYLLINKLNDNTGRKKKSGTASASRVDAAEDGSVRSQLKLSKTPQYSDRGARIMSILGGVLTAGGFLSTLEALGNLSMIPHIGLLSFLADLFYPLGIAAGGVALVLAGRSMERRNRRFAKYLATAGQQQNVSMIRLAEAAGVSPNKLEKDLEIMVEKGYWGPGAYLDLGRGMLFRSQQAAAEWQQAKTAAEQKAPEAAEQGYSGMLRALRRANDRIADETLSRKIDRLEYVAGRIFQAVENDETKRAKAATFLNYYMPTTQKLLDSYAEFEEAGIRGSNVTQAKAKIEKTMDYIVAGFERQLDELYRTDVMDIDSDIRVMESMLRRDGGSVEDDFGLGGGSAVQAEEN